MSTWAVVNLEFLLLSDDFLLLGFHEWKSNGFGSIRTIFQYFCKIFITRSEGPPLSSLLTELISYARFSFTFRTKLLLTKFRWFIADDKETGKIGFHGYLAPENVTKNKIWYIIRQSKFLVQTAHNVRSDLGSEMSGILHISVCNLIFTNTWPTESWFCRLILSKTTKLKLLQTERVFRGQF